MAEEQKRIKVKLGDRKRVMFYESDRDVDMDEIREFCEINEIEVPEENSGKYWDIVTQILEPEWDDFIGNVACSDFPACVVVVGKNGLWNGERPVFHPEYIKPTGPSYQERLKAVTAFFGKFIPNCQCELRIGCDKDGLFVEVPHHDGTNFYHIREVNERGQRYWDACTERYEDPSVSLAQPCFSRKIDWWLA